ncbi:MAG: hypothetical protein K9M03_02860 [Kiritimatiellales bacterium]|nr:hypothetical protein [Kiritimatiellales bacterium]
MNSNITRIGFTLLSCVILTSCNPQQEIRVRPITEIPDNAMWEYRNDIEPVIEQYLLSHNDFIWDHDANSTPVCVFHNFDPRNWTSPYYLWVRCSTFSLKDGLIEEESGVSIPAVLLYPEEVSMLAPEHFTHQIPGSGSDYGKDIEKLFPEDIRKTMREIHDLVLIDLHYEMASKVMNTYAEFDPPFPWALKQNCSKDSDCMLPMSYAIRSNCPYGMQCKEEKCEVVCPDFEHPEI